MNAQVARLHTVSSFPPAALQLAMSYSALTRREIVTTSLPLRDQAACATEKVPW